MIADEFSRTIFGSALAEAMDRAHQKGPPPCVYGWKKEAHFNHFTQAFESPDQLVFGVASESSVPAEALFVIPADSDALRRMSGWYEPRAVENPFTIAEKQFPALAKAVLGVLEATEPAPEPVTHGTVPGFDVGNREAAEAFARARVREWLGHGYQSEHALGIGGDAWLSVDWATDDYRIAEGMIYVDHAQARGGGWLFIFRDLENQLIAEGEGMAIAAEADCRRRCRERALGPVQKFVVTGRDCQEIVRAATPEKAVERHAADQYAGKTFIEDDSWNVLVHDADYNFVGLYEARWARSARSP